MTRKKHPTDPGLQPIDEGPLPIPTGAVPSAGPTPEMQQDSNDEPIDEGPLPIPTGTVPSAGPTPEMLERQKREAKAAAKAMEAEREEAEPDVKKAQRLVKQLIAAGARPYRETHAHVDLPEGRLLVLPEGVTAA